MKTINHIILLSAITLSISSTMTPTTRAAEPLAAQTMDWQTSRQGKLGYLLYLPPGYEAAAGKKWPLMLFLHGAGERGDNIQQVAVHGPPKLIRQGTNFPFIVVAPQCPSNERWQTEALLGLLDNLLARLAVDTNRIYVTGLSMGGYGTWNLAFSAPGRFAAVAPICGGANMIDALLVGREQADAIRSLPVWAFHGAKDPVVPVDESTRLVAALQRIGCTDVKITIYPEAQHDSWTETYDNPEFYAWLLSRERGHAVPATAQAPATKPIKSDALMAADTAFAKLAAQKGAAEAFYAYAAEDATLLPAGEMPIKGREAIRQAMSALKDGQLKWSPTASELSRSADLGYTWGFYDYVSESSGKQTKASGKYLTIWRKQADGSWKFVVDVGNPNPEQK